MRTRSSTATTYDHNLVAADATPTPPSALFRTWTLRRRDGFAARSVGSASPMLPDSQFDLESDIPTRAGLGRTSKSRSISTGYSSSFGKIEPLSVARGAEFEAVLLSTEREPPG